MRRSFLRSPSPPSFRGREAEPGTHDHAPESLTRNRNLTRPHAEVAGAADPRSTHDRSASFEAPLRGAPQDEEGGGVRPAAELDRGFRVRRFAPPRNDGAATTRRHLLAGAALLGLGAACPALAQTSPARIVSLGGAVTEIVHDLGAADRIVAADTTSIVPAEILRTRPNVGYLRQLSAEGILSVGPTLVLASEGAGPPDALKLVEAAGVRIVAIPEEPSAAGVLARIRIVAEAIGRAAEGQALAASVEARFAALAADRAKLKGARRGLFILSLQNGRAMVGGRDTTADGMFRLAGIENAAAAIAGYKPMTDEAIIAAQPDAVVMMAVGPGGAPPADVLAGPALAQTPAGRDGRLVTMNGLYLLGFGPRTPDAARDLMVAFHGKPGE